MKKRNYNHRIFIFGLTFLLSFTSQIFFAQEKNQSEKTREVEVISNSKLPIYKDDFKIKIVFKEELSIGQIEGDENYMFGGSVHVNTDEKGNFFVTDWDSKRILKYDPEGKYLLTIGGLGQGPGEFQNISRARFDKEGNIYVTDISNQRLSFFDTDGNFLRQISMPEVFEGLCMNSKGHFISSRSVMMDTGSGMGFKIEYGVFDENFELVSEFYSRIPVFDPPEGRDKTSMAKYTAGIISNLAYQPRPVYVVADNDLIFFGFPDKYEINVCSPEGKKIKTITREYDPIKVGEKDKRYFEETTATRFMRDRSEDYIKEAIRFVAWPKFKPAYHNFILMENGWLFVVVEFIEGEYTLCDIFDEEGIYIGHFKADVPPDFLFFKNGKAYTVFTEDSYKFVKRYSFDIQEYRFN